MSDKINILIVEDEGIVAMGMEDILQSEGYEVVAIVDEGKAAIELVEKENIDVVLLDIHIKGEWDGIETAEQLAAVKDIPFIFLTAFSDRTTIDRAKETNPAAYLTKPYQSKNLLMSIEIALNNFAFRKSSLSPVVPLIPGNRPSGTKQKEPILCFNDAVFIKQNYKFVKINLNEIYYLETEKNYTHIVTKDKKFIVRQALNAMMDKLSRPYFIQVHRSYAINIDRLDTFNDHSICLENFEIPLGRNYKEDFFRRFDFL